MKTVGAIHELPLPDVDGGASWRSNERSRSRYKARGRAALCYHGSLKAANPPPETTRQKTEAEQDIATCTPKSALG